MKLSIKKETRIYVVCPPNISSGGPELLHQIVHKLNKIGIKSYIFYYPSSISNPVHSDLQEYGNPYVIEIEDIPDNILLVPETYVDILNNYRLIQKVIWWLSIDFHYDFAFKKSFRGRIITRLNKIFKNIIEADTPRALFAKNSALPERFNDYLHFAQSTYAHQHLSRKNIVNVEYLSDYLNSTFINRETKNPKRDIVLYNPKKGSYFTNKLIKKSPDIQWVPITKMNRSEVAHLLETAKVYVDFGCHPGKDRIPREAAISGCCLITGRMGSANFFQDIPIPEIYKFYQHSRQIPNILTMIRSCLNDYKIHILEFEFYREKIKNEERQFNKDLFRIFMGKKQS